ncbi:MAG TPA: DUF3604 domain-containing protein [Armatimonadetes bacterium]|jgi:hypothetical protein|nr:DUF3604 domain-containing protein [Armatimonadota bacterium]
MLGIDVPGMCGTCTVSPTDPVVAGSYGTWQLTYTAGQWGIDDGGTVLVLWRFATDWGTPQTEDPRAEDYLSVTTDSSASLRVRFDSKAHVRPWRKGVVIDVFDNGILPGETITITYGDTSGGSPGSRVQTFCETSFEFRVMVNPIATGRFIKLRGCPEIMVIAGAPEALKVIAPTCCRPGEQGVLRLKFEDAWGNPTGGFDGVIRLAADPLLGLPSEVAYVADETGVMPIPFACPAEGVYRVSASAEQMEATSNPIECSSQYALRRYWGDLHGQSESTVGTNTVADYFRFARDKACVDFCSHQGNDFQLTRDNWAEVQREVRAHNAPGRFVTLLGYEWSGNTGGGGDHNVWYLRDNEPIYRSGHALVDDDADIDTDRYPIESLYEQLQGRDVVLAAHVGGRRADLARHDESLKRLVEVYSAWGEFEWMLTESLRLGHTVGVVANSDGHKGRPGASYPGVGQFGVYGGLTCVYAPDLTREAVFEALRERRCYGTTGQRINMRFTAGDYFMGSIEPWRGFGKSPFVVEVQGTEGIESIDLFADDKLIARYDGFAGRGLSESVRVSWGGARIRGRDRAAHWYGRLQITGARVLGVEPYAFDTPAEGIIGADKGMVMWRSTTVGDEDGVILHLDRIEGAVLRFHTQTYNLMLALDGLNGLEPRRFDAGGVGRHVSLQRLPAEAPPADVRVEFPVTGTGFGPAAYWVRVRQVDGAKAWSSPIFLR